MVFVRPSISFNLLELSPRMTSPDTKLDVLYSKEMQSVVGTNVQYRLVRCLDVANRVVKVLLRNPAIANGSTQSIVWEQLMEEDGPTQDFVNIIKAELRTMALPAGY